MNQDYHLPVMLRETIEGLCLCPNGVYVDATFGGGGHSRFILEHLSEQGRLLAFDQDQDAVKKAEEEGWNQSYGTKFTLVDQNFRFLKNYLRFYKALPVDGILADLGVSSHQFDVAERGFSIREDAPLDMRMDRRGTWTAQSIVTQYTEEKLSRLFYVYGDIPCARKMAKTIVEERETNAIETTGDLIKIVSRWAEKGKENKFLATVFQALRMEVNQEEQVLEDFLTQAVEVLKPGGRLVVMSYHSVEDRLVKNFIRSGRADGELQKDFYGNPLNPLKAVNRKIIQASEEEITKNPRARSAKLRIAEKR